MNTLLKMPIIAHKTWHPHPLTILSTLLLLALVAGNAPLTGEDSDTQRREAIRNELAQMTAAAELSQAFHLIHELVAPSVASIHINQSLVQLDRQSGTVETLDLQLGEGSGFVVASTPEHSYLLTNAHVVLRTNRRQDFIRDDSDRPLWHSNIRVSLSDQRMVDAEPIGADTKSDLAMLRIAIGDLPPVAWGDSDAARVGDWVLALGFPLGVGYSATAGIISAKARSTGIYRREGGFEAFIQTDAAINPGNSGGPMLNLQGQVIGVNANIMTRSGGASGIGFAIPANLAHRVAEDLMKDGIISRPMIGVQMSQVDPGIAEERQLSNRQAVSIVRVMPGSPAAEAGIQRGDIILAVEGRPVAGIEQFRARIAAARIGHPLRLSVWRNGTTSDLEIIPSSWEDYTEMLGKHMPEEDDAVRWSNFGMSLSDDEQRGIMISTVDEDSPAFRAGLRPGTRILRIGGIGPVHSSQDLAHLDSRSELTLEVYHQRRILLVRLRQP
ncbi:MAG: PDZ domain-containing protein [Planctomycetota bacterium]|nr:MAG: PDZ domain-containing protein [Planctomycetota bacterium]